VCGVCPIHLWSNVVTVCNIFVTVGPWFGCCFLVLSPLLFYVLFVAVCQIYLFP